MPGENIEQLHRRRTSGAWKDRIFRLLRPPDPLIRNPREHDVDPPLGRWNLYIGGAGSAVDGYINVDLFPLPGANVAASVEQLPFPSNLFQRVECDAVLEHVEHPEPAVREIERVLAPGGFAHLVVPFCHPFHQYPADFRRYTLDGLKQLAGGLEVVSAGWRTGPTATLLVFLLEYIKIWLPWRPPRAVAHGVAGWLLFPLRYLDLLLFRSPRAGQIGNHCYVWLKKGRVQETGSHGGDQWPAIVAGFPEMWQPVHGKYHAFFEAAKKLEELCNIAIRRPISGQPQGIISHLVKIIINDYGAVLTLVLNGYGVAAMKIARSMFENECNIFHLRNNPDDVRDYLDWDIISAKRLYEQMDQDLQARVPAERVAEMNADYARVEARFLNTKGDLRRTWCKDSVYARAKAAGLEGLYFTFYAIASSMHHGDIDAVIYAFNPQEQDVETVPSYAWLDNALTAAHGSMVRSLSYYNEVANLGLDDEMGRARDECVALFKSLKP